VGYTANADLQDLFDAAPLRRSCRRIVRRATEAIKDGAARRSPIAEPPPGVSGTEFAGGRGRAPGTLKASWYDTDVDETRAPSGVPRFSAEAATDDPVAPHVEWPTRPHLIRPRADRAPASVRETGRPRRGGSDPQARLRFINRNGRVVYASEVWHPGTQGTHMMRDSLAEVDGTWEQRIGIDEVKLCAREQAALVRT
jgi:hypothetical protein